MVKKWYYNPDWEKPVHINEDTWAQLVTVAKVCLMHNEEADLFDMFNTYREHFLGGWIFTNALKARVDAEIEKEFAR